MSRIIVCLDTYLIDIINELDFFTIVELRNEYLKKKKEFIDINAARFYVASVINKLIKINQIEYVGFNNFGKKVYTKKNCNEFININNNDKINNLIDGKVRKDLFNLIILYRNELQLEIQNIKSISDKSILDSTIDNKEKKVSEILDCLDMIYEALYIDLQTI
ncbi:hypothetical protein [Photobacterium leiognathi]|uniref:hypothetical protein n=1 Tax=Photobacterium leiognathi TaxID=553611 RepID=UPI0029816AA7|nr:hypothetical protein [Photobacterium leiognathi]